MKPIICNDIFDIKRIALEMRKTAEMDPDLIDDYRQSETEFEAIEKAKNILPGMIEDGRVKLLKYKGQIITVVFTMLSKGDKKEWNLSMSHPFLPAPAKVNDEYAFVIAETFLGSGFEEVEPKAVWKSIRHFVKYV